MAFIGNTNTTQAFTPAVDYFSGNGSTTAFTLSRPVASVAQVEAVIDNVVQNPSSAYTVSSNTITFTSAPLSGTNNIYVRYTSPITQVIAPGQGTVNTTALGNITNIASGNSSLTLQTGSSNTTAVTVDTSQNVGIGTTSPATKLQVTGGSIHVDRSASGGASQLLMTLGASSGGNFGQISNTGTYWALGYGSSQSTVGTQSVVWDSSGNLLVGTTSVNSGKLNVVYTGTYGVYVGGASGASTQMIFFSGATNTGSISSNGSNTAFNTSSDYRLKENIAPMTGCLSKVQALKPVTYRWKESGLESQGFIAHELAEVCPEAVTGAKDAVDANGNPVYQGIDTSFLVATLTAAIQELKALVDAQATEIAELKAKVGV